MIDESRGAAVLKNYLSIAAVFMIFALAVAVAKLIINDDAVSYLAGVSVTGLLWVACRVSKIYPVRGFFPYCFAFVLCMAAFPVTDVMPSSYGSTILYTGFIGMLVTMVVLMWRAFTHVSTVPG